MTRKDFEALAAIVRDAALVNLVSADQVTGAERVRQRVASELAALCAQQNPRFNRARFLTACGVRQ